MSFLENYSAINLRVTLIKFCVLTLINFLVLYLLLYLDNNYIIGETAISILSIPIGLINFGILIVSLNGLKKMNWYSLLYAAFSLLNFLLYVKISLNMYSQSGSMIN